jgi:hypothetical protein
VLLALSSYPFSSGIGQHKQATGAEIFCEERDYNRQNNEQVQQHFYPHNTIKYLIYAQSDLEQREHPFLVRNMIK